MDQHAHTALFAMGAGVALVLLYKLLGGTKAVPATPFLNKERQTLVISDIKNISHDVKRIRLALPHPKMKLGLPVGKHFKVFAPNVAGKVPGQWNGRDDAEKDLTVIERKYTPTTSDDDIGFVDLVIKVYKGGVIDRFPDGGKMSQYIDTRKVGDELEVSGPWGMIEYIGDGGFQKGSKVFRAKNIGMIAGGTGITPMLQIIAAVLKENNDVKLSILYANQTEEDILVRDLLESCKTRYPGRFKLWYTVDRPPANWKFSSGFITAEMIKEHLPAPSDDTVVVMCGPPPMIEFACKKNLDALGYPKEAQHAW